jgi:hypothetical protein
MRMPTADEVLRTCRACGRSGAFSISEHAHTRAREQGHSHSDLVHALAHATFCEPADSRWAAYGPSLDGTQVTMFVVLAAGALSVV